MSHNHGPRQYNRAFTIGIALNIVFVIIEAGYGVFSDSLALIADAGHNLSDVVGLLLAWGASYLAGKSATERRTYGFGKATVMASLASSVILLVALGGITWEAFGRFREPAEVKGMTVIVVAGIGVVINTLTALLFVRDQKHDLNIRGAFLHMAADAAVSLGVVFAGVLIMATGNNWIDPVVSLLVAAFIFAGTWGLLRDSLNYAVDAVPKNIDITGIRQYLSDLEDVILLHDLHVWPLSTTSTALTVHLVTRQEKIDNLFLATVQKHLHDHFGIEHATIQVESRSQQNRCLLDDHPSRP